MPNPFALEQSISTSSSSSATFSSASSSFMVPLYGATSFRTLTPRSAFFLEIKNYFNKNYFKNYEMPIVEDLLFHGQSPFREVFLGFGIGKEFSVRPHLHLHVLGA